MKRDKAGGGAPPDGLTDLACACATARQVARTLTQLYDGFLAGAGLEAPQFALLMTLASQGATSQASIGRRYALDKTTVSRNLKWLERQGWVESAAGAADKRERRFTLTAEGQRKLAAARIEWKKAQQSLRGGMTAKQWGAMFVAFRTVARAAHGIQRERNKESV
jgi:DNA-binding MarR family transcriptional regulator